MTTVVQRHPRGTTVVRAVLDATIATIVAEGSTLISIDDVAALAGVNKTTIYRRWPTRANLVLAAITDHAHAAVPVPDTGSLHEDLHRLGRLVRDSLSSTSGRVLHAATRTGADPSLDVLRDRYWNERLGAAAAILERGAARGECAPVAAADVLIEQLVAPIHFRTFVLDRPVTDEYLDALVASFERKLSAGATR